MPPPPPPNLSAPPGAVYRQGPNLSGQGLRRVGGLATAITVLLGVVLVGQIGSLITLGSAVDASEEYLAGGLSDDEWSEKLLGYVGATSLTGLSTIAIAVVTMVWLYRVAANHRALGRQVTFGPGWAIGGWFLPPGLWVLPALFTREHWKAAEPTSAPGTDTWRSSPEPWLVWVWFALFGPISLLANFSSGVGTTAFGGDIEDAAKAYVDAGSAAYLAIAVTAAAAVAWLLVVRGLTARHRQLTGEAAR